MLGPILKTQCHGHWLVGQWSSGTKNLPDWFLTIADLLNVGFDRLSVVQFEGQLINNMNMNT